MLQNQPLDPRDRNGFNQKLKPTQGVSQSEISESQEFWTSQNYAEAIVEAIQTALVVIDPNLRVQTANPAFYQLFQVSPTEAEQQSVFELGNQQWHSPELLSCLEKLLSHGTARGFDQVEVVRDCGQFGSKTMRVKGQKMAEVDRVGTILLAIEDITERKQLDAANQAQAQKQGRRADKAETANQAKDEFLSTIAHELRTLLTSILSWAILLRNRDFDQTTTQAGLQTIELCARAQYQLIEDLLDISSIVAGRLRLNLVPTQLNSVIELAVNIIQISARQKQVEISFNQPQDSVLMMCDPDRLQQVMLNLLANAIKFTPEGGRITVKLVYHADQAQIQVSDTGLGISADFLPYVFDRFRQAEKAETQSNPGLGLGLLLVRQLVELHGGSVQAESSGEGQGATFTVRLPLQNPIHASRVQ